MRTRIAILIVAALIIALLAYKGVVVYRAFEQQRTTTFFSSALAAQDITTNVEANGVRYEVESGAVQAEGGGPVAATSTYAALRLAYAQTLAERTPIAAIPGTDPDSLDQAADELAKTTQDLANIQQNQQNADAVETALYPIDLLHAFANTERARLRFVQSGADTDELAYESAQQALLLTYERELSDYSSAFQSIVPGNAGDYEVFEGTISRASILSTLNDLQKGIERTQDTLDARNACIDGHISSCDATQLELPVVATATSTASSTESAPPYLQEIRDAYVDATGVDSYAEGDVIQLDGAACLQALKTDPLFVLVDRRDADDLTLGPEFVGDIEFVPNVQYGEVPYYQYFSDHGIAHSYFPVWEPYKCPELASESSRVFDVSDIQTIAKEQPFSADVTNAANAKQLRSLEQALVDPADTIVTESDALAYLATARSALSQQAKVSTTTDERLANAILDTQDGSDRFDLFIRRISDDDDYNLILLKNNVPVELDAQYLFYVQSDFFDLFMGTNGSLISDVQPPIESGAGTSTLPFVPYSTLRQTIPNSELVRDMAFFFQIHKKTIGVVPIE